MAIQVDTASDKPVRLVSSVTIPRLWTNTVQAGAPNPETLHQVLVKHQVSTG
jgi:hypothetical protein